MKQSVATYLPESMIITLKPTYHLFSLQSGSLEAPSEGALGFLFHEYLHFLHNVSTVSGFFGFLNALSAWRAFRRTVQPNGFSAGSKSFSQPELLELEKLFLVHRANRSVFRPDFQAISNPVHVRITSALPIGEVVAASETLVTRLHCAVIATEAGGSTEEELVKVGTPEILEGVAYLLQDRLVQSLDLLASPTPAPWFPYRITESLAEFYCPGLSVDATIAVLLASLQTCDAPIALPRLFEIAATAIANGKDPCTELRNEASEVSKEQQPLLNNYLADLLVEFDNSSLIGRAIHFIVPMVAVGLARRLLDPFLEFGLLQRAKRTYQSTQNLEETFKSLTVELLPCAVLQERDGSADTIMRDELLTFHVSALDTPSPEDQMRIVHSIFDLVSRHMSSKEFVPTEYANARPCPFYTCCNLSLRHTNPGICAKKPWESVNPKYWPPESTCWYGAAMKLTRPPALAA